MRLTNDQINDLIALIEPRLASETQRAAALQIAFKEDARLLKAASAYNQQAGAEFTAQIVNRLIARQVRTASGELAIVRLLEALQDDPALIMPLQAYIDTLRAPDGSIEREIPIHLPTRRTSPEAEAERPQSRRRSSPFRRALRRIGRVVRWRIALVVLIVAVTIPTAGVVVFATDAYVRVQESLTSVQRVISTLNKRAFAELTQADFERLQVSVQNLGRSLSRARQQTGLLQRLAFLSPELRGSFAALDTAESVALAAQDMLEGLQPVLFFLVENRGDGALTAQASSGERIIELLRIGQGKFVGAGERLTAARARLDGLDLSPLSANLLLQIGQIDDYQRQIADINATLIELPDALTAIFGLNDPADYLILSQNSDELRPSGGYISTYGWVRVRRLRIADYGYSATTTSSPNPPPAERAAELNIPTWWIQFKKPIYTAWDGSWYADFPSTARMAAWYYEAGQNPRSPVDGVIGIDMLGFEKLLGGLGAVSVPGYETPVTAENFRALVYQIRSEGEGSQPHKEFLAALYRQILANWQTIGQAQADGLLSATLEALRGKHIMLYFADPKLNQFVERLGWAGAQTPDGSDYLMVADANLSNKSNRSISRAQTYDVQLQPDNSAKSRLSLSYDYSAALAAQDPAVKPEHYGSQIDYFNLMQIFVPKDSQLADTDNLPGQVTVIRPTLGSTAVTQFVTTVRVNYDTRERFQFVYSVPNAVAPFGPFRRYRLLLQKQPGTAGDAVNVQVMLPAGARTITVTPDPVARYTVDQPILEFRLTLASDQWIEVVYQ